LKVGDVLGALLADGGFLVATRGSHRQFKHATKPGRVTVPGKPSDDLAPGTLGSIIKQAGLKS
jgi:predicted RNA binding protein YcfA (HicA-like mRNA interferase family)